MDFGFSVFWWILGLVFRALEISASNLQTIRTRIMPGSLGRPWVLGVLGLWGVGA